MPITKAARRYATALLELGKERDEVDELLNDIEYIHNTLEESRDLVLFLRSPVINFDDKIQALEKIFFDELEEPTKLFLKLLSRKDRINLLDQVTEAFIEKYKEHAGIITVEVFVARELSNEQQELLHKNLEQKTQKNVDMNITVDEDLKGGMAIRIEDTVIDGTVKHKLKELEESLLSTTVE
ncbi:ATP synthase F1 subunit delta [Aliifodinibius salipaludis]|uniref:ATP synthase subunit delta n=1 Tax=Fodinibius salipaludis TaxID=2032627 RepID=A0A2A2GEP2_9BACT|nr:ATP synthase F1 subunit delta [Aliifodinibius salipaludis]PAU95680.1 ATP synthase F1 subunit delta [Aliifodinibius salipaludis]